MQTRKIGSLDVSVVGLGTNNFGSRLDESATAKVVHAAIDAGVTFIDTADMYGATKSEQYIGSALKGRRDEVVLATKFGNKLDDAHLGGGKPDYVRSAAEDSLRRLQTDRIDLYILHNPDPNTPIVDTLGALGELVAAGKVVEIGCSNFSLAQLKEAEAAAKSGPRFVNLQNRYNLLDREVERDILSECARSSVGFVPYSPLAGGFLTGKFRRNEQAPTGTRISAMPDERRNSVLSPTNFDVLEGLEVLGDKRGNSLLELIMSWLLAKPAVASVISGAMNPEQVQSNAKAGECKLDQADLDYIDALTPV